MSAISIISPVFKLGNTVIRSSGIVVSICRGSTLGCFGLSGQVAEYQGHIAKCYITEIEKSSDEPSSPSYTFLCASEMSPPL